MELEEAIKRLEILNVINKKQLENGDMFLYEEETKEEIHAIDRVIKYIKEESIPRAQVEKRIEELDKIRRENVNTRFVLEYSMYNAISNEIDDLEEILNKGEK